MNAKACLVHPFALHQALTSSIGYGFKKLNPKRMTAKRLVEFATVRPVAVQPTSLVIPTLLCQKCLSFVFSWHSVHYMASQSLVVTSPMPFRRPVVANKFF